jgi:hypothetical protein
MVNPELAYSGCKSSCHQFTTPWRWASSNEYWVLKHYAKCHLRGGQSHQIPATESFSANPCPDFCPTAFVLSGGTSPGDDVAQLVRATWRETRNAYKNNGLVQFEFQQFLFACQARILLKLNRPSEVLHHTPLTRHQF